MKIAVDFDGTIVEHAYPKIGKEIPGAIDTLKQLVRDRHQIVLWTSREGHLLDEAVEYCHQRGLVFFAVNAEYPEARWKHYKMTRKPIVDLFIDDRSLGGIPDWDVIYDMITQDLLFSDVIKAASQPASLEGQDDGKSQLIKRIIERCRKFNSRIMRRQRRW